MAAASNARDSSLTAWVVAHHPGLLRLLRGILGAAHEAEDTAQEAWLSIMNAEARLRPEAPLWPFLRQTAVRKAIDRRRERSREPLPLTHEPAALFERGPSFDLSALDTEQRACLLLFYWEGLSVAEIAGELRVPAGTVKTWMFRARAQLRKSMEDPAP